MISVELLILGFDGILRRLHILSQKKGGINVHPIDRQVDSSKGCMEATTPIQLHKYHSSVVCMSYEPVSNLLAVGGSHLNNPGTLSSLSLWKLLDRPPFYELVHSTNASGSGGFISLMKEKLLVPGYRAVLYKVLLNDFQYS
jgi:hypothetical protein